MDTVIAKGVLATFFIGCCPQLRVPEQRLAVLLSLFVYAEYMISIKPNLCNLLTIKMLLPTLDNQVGILIDDRLNFLQVICLYLLLYKQCELTSVPYELSHATVPFNVNVDRLMLLTVKEEGESKESKYFWHISISFYSDSAKIGIIFDTNNFFAKKNVSGDFSLSLHRIRAEQMMILF